jgi:hypothetical protein
MEWDRVGRSVNLARKLRCLGLALDVRYFEGVGSGWSAELPRDADHRRELALVIVCRQALASLSSMERWCTQ